VDPDVIELAANRTRVQAQLLLDPRRGHGRGHPVSGRLHQRRTAEERREEPSHEGIIGADEVLERGQRDPGLELPYLIPGDEDIARDLVGDEARLDPLLDDLLPGADDLPAERTGIPCSSSSVRTSGFTRNGPSSIVRRNGSPPAWTITRAPARCASWTSVR